MFFLMGYSVLESCLSLSIFGFSSYLQVNIPDLSVVLLVLGGAESGLLGQLTKQSQSFTSQRSKHQRCALKTK